MRHATKEGEKLFKAVTVRLVIPGEKHTVLRYYAPKSQGYTEENITDLLGELSSKLETDYPTINFRLVPLKGGNQFNIIGTTQDDAVVAFIDSELA